MISVQRILVLCRLEQYSSDALREGVKLAQLYGASLMALRIISNPVDQQAINAPGLFIKGEEYHTYLSIREQYQEELDEAIRQVEKDGIRIEALVTDREPVAEIQRIVAERRVDLIVALAHQEGRLEHLLFGGENDELVRRLPCSLMLLKYEPRPAP